MPIYEFKCPDCKTEFEVMLPFSDAEKPTQCPKCNALAQKQIAHFSSSSSGKASKITFEVEADTLAEAREEVKHRMPFGFHLLTQRTISGGKLKTITQIADTTEAAFEKAIEQVPKGAVIEARKEISAPNQKVITVQDFYEQSALAQAKEQLTGLASIKKVTLTTRGKPGVFGFGKLPNCYEIIIFQPAVVEIIFKEKAKIRATVGDKAASEKQTVGDKAAFGRRKDIIKTNMALGRGRGYEKWQTCSYGVLRTEGQLGFFTTGDCCTNRRAARLFGMVKWSTFIRAVTPRGLFGKSPFPSEAYVLSPRANFSECSQCPMYNKTRSAR